MRYVQAITAALAMMMLAALVACSSGSSSTPPPPPAISVSVSTTATSVNVNGTLGATATVSNDSANAGVTWSCSGTCGSFNPTTTASGTATTFTAPATSGSATITATSVTDPTKSGTATISVTGAPITLADGNYVYSLAGTDSNATNTTALGFPSPYFVTGVFTVTGGAITGGEQDFVDFGAVATDFIDPAASSYLTTSDGNLQITLTTCTGIVCPGPDPVVGVAGVETINASLITATKARIVEFDAFATSSGTLELQDSTAIAASPVGGYAFGVQGIDSGGNTLAIGGVLNLDGTGALTSSSVFDQNRGGNLSANETFDTTASSVTGPDVSGRLLISLKPTDTTLPIINFAGYIVDATHIQLAEVADPSGSTTGGTALGQNAANLAVEGNSYVVSLNGFDVNGGFQIAGALTLASGNVTGSISYNDFVQQSTSVPITAGTFVADATGRITLTGVTDGNLLAPLNLQLYVDGNGNAMALTMDTTDITEGPGYQQTTGGTFGAGAYVMATTGLDGTNEIEFDAVGPIVSDGTATFTGFADLNWLSDGTAALPTANLPVDGAFTAPSGDVSTGAGNTITGLDVTTPTGADAFDYYIVDTTRVVAIETDSFQLTLGSFELVQ